MEFKNIVMQRYAVKKFDGQIIDKKKIDELFEIIRYSASSFNLQPWKIKVITDPKIKEKLHKASWNQEQIITCSHLLIFCADKDLTGKAKLLEQTSIKSGATKEQLKVYLDMIHNSINNMGPDQQLSWAQRQVYLAVGNAINGAKSLGFDSCPMEGFNATEYAKILKLPENLVPTVLVPIGYTTDSPRAKLRFSKEEVFF
jgi:nitroreductase / dihydropteridine reductase